MEEQNTRPLLRIVADAQTKNNYLEELKQNYAQRKDLIELKHTVKNFCDAVDKQQKMRGRV